MIRKHILNGLILSLALTLIPTPAHAGWLSSISNYFNQPTKNALMITTAAAGVSLLATFACAWNWWKSSKALTQKNEEAVAASNTALNALKMKLHGEQLATEQRAQNSFETVLAKKQAELTKKDKLIADLHETVTTLSKAADGFNTKKTLEKNAKLSQRAELLAKNTDLYERIRALESQNESQKEELATLRKYKKEAQEQNAE